MCLEMLRISSYMMANLSNINNSPVHGALLSNSQSFTSNTSSDRVYDEKKSRVHCLAPTWNHFATKGICTVHDTSYSSCTRCHSRDSASVHDLLAGYEYTFEDYLPGFFLPGGEHDFNGPDVITGCKVPATELRPSFAEIYCKDMMLAENSYNEILCNTNSNKELRDMNAELNKTENQLCSVEECIQDDHECMVKPEIDLHELCYLSPVYGIQLNKGKQNADASCYSPVSCSEENVEEGGIEQYIASPPGNSMAHSTYYDTPHKYVCTQSNKEELQSAMFKTTDKKLCRGENQEASCTFQGREDLCPAQGSSSELCLSSSASSTFSRGMLIHMKKYSPIAKPDSSLYHRYSSLSPSLKSALWNTGRFKVHEIKTSEGKWEVHTQGTYETMCPYSSPAVYYRKQASTNQNLDFKGVSLISKPENICSNGYFLDKLKEASDVYVPDKHSTGRSPQSASEEKLYCISNKPLKTPVRKLTYRNQCLNSATVTDGSLNSSAKESVCSFLSPGSSGNDVHYNTASGSLPKSISVRLKGLSPKVKTVFPLCSRNKGYGGKNINEGVCEIYGQGTYKTELCNKWESMNSECPYGENCRFAHGLEELRIVARHSKYKTQVCRMVSAGEECRYGHRCHFRHALKEDE